MSRLATSRSNPCTPPTRQASLTRMLEVLDQLDGDPDLEPTMGYLSPDEIDKAEPDEGDEPSQG